MNFAGAFILIVFSMQAMQEQCHNPSSLFKAVKNNDLELVRTILTDSFCSEEGIKNLPYLLESQSFPQRRTPLLQATIDDNRAIAKLLVAAGANIFAVDLTGVGCFSRVLMHNQHEMLQVFITTPKQKKRLELALLTIFKFPQSHIPVTPSIAMSVENLISTYNNYTPKYQWLNELAEASKKAAPGHPQRDEYVRFAPLYKEVARFMYCNYIVERERIVKAHSKDSYWNRLPLDIRHLAIDYLLGSDKKKQKEYLDIIEQMPEQ